LVGVVVLAICNSMMWLCLRIGVQIEYKTTLCRGLVLDFDSHQREFMRLLLHFVMNKSSYIKLNSLMEYLHLLTYTSAILTLTFSLYVVVFVAFLTLDGSLAGTTRWSPHTCGLVTTSTKGDTSRHCSSHCPPHTVLMTQSFFLPVCRISPR
jgi:hypothetical protein